MQKRPLVSVSWINLSLVTLLEYSFQRIAPSSSILVSQDVHFGTPCINSHIPLLLLEAAWGLNLLTGTPSSSPPGASQTPSSANPWSWKSSCQHSSSSVEPSLCSGRRWGRSASALVSIRVGGAQGEGSFWRTWEGFSGIHPWEGSGWAEGWESRVSSQLCPCLPLLPLICSFQSRMEAISSCGIRTFWTFHLKLSIFPAQNANGLLLVL